MSFPTANDGCPPHQPSAVEQAALDWVARLDRGLTREEEAEFERWLAADMQHAAMFGEFDGAWTLLNRMREKPEAIPAASTRPFEPDAFAPFRTVAAPAGGMPSIAHERRIRFPFSRLHSLSLLAAAAVLALVHVGWLRPARIASRQNASYAASAVTRLGELRKLNLPDGSVVRLNTDSAAEVHYTPTGRIVRLARGEAHFTVAKNRARPFIVTAAGVDIQAVGTAFNVRVRTEAVEVLVTEGKVRVNDDPVRTRLARDEGSTAPSDFSPRRDSDGTSTDRHPASEIRPLVAGEKVSIPLVRPSLDVPTAAWPVIVVPPVEIERTLAWQEQRLEFESAPLWEMAAEFNRYNHRKLVIPDTGLAAQHFGGTFRPHDMAGFVRMLEIHFNIVAEQRENETILRRASHEPGDSR